MARKPGSRSGTPLYDLGVRLAHSAERYLAVIEPIKEAGMQDYRLDEIEDPRRPPAAVDRLTGKPSSRRIDRSGGELPGRKADERR